VANSRHLTDQELVAELDRERPSGAPQTAHLESCWSCRTRLDELETAMRGFVRLRDDVLLSAPEPPALWPGLGDGMDRIDGEGFGLSLWTRMVRRAMASLTGTAAVAFCLQILSAVAGHTMGAATNASRQPLRRPDLWWVSTGFGWLKRSTIVTTLVMSGTAIWLWTTWSDPRVSAAQVLDTARAADTQALLPGHASHRVLSVEERLLPKTDVVRRQRVEVWQHRGRGLTARRLYNDAGQIAAGEWARPDGTRTIYRAGERPTVEAATRTPAALSTVDIWRREPSADDFIGLAASLDEVTVNSRQSDYLLAYRPKLPAANGLIEATLAVGKSNRRATAQTLLFREEGRIREFTLKEVGIDQIPVEKVAAYVFEPEPLLLGEIPAVSVPDVTLNPEPAPAPAAHTVSALTSVQLDEIEMDAAYRLFRSKIWLGKNSDITRTTDGLQIRSTVASEDDKSALDRSFDGFIRHPAVKIEFVVPEPAATPPDAPPDPVLLQTAPVYPMLRDFFAWHKSEARRDEAIHTITDNVLSTINRRAERLRALQTLIARWPQDRLYGLELESVVTWQRMVQEHAHAIEQDTELLRVQLVPVFRADVAISPKVESSPPTIMASLGAAAEAAAQLEVLVPEQDQALRAAFDPCAAAPCASIDVPRVLESFDAVESVAGRFAHFYLKLSGAAR
jgi:hypothetical protein